MLHLTNSSSLAKVSDIPKEEVGPSILWALRRLVATSPEIPRDPKNAPFAATQDIGRIEIGWARGGPGRIQTAPDVAGTAQVTALILLAGRAVITDDRGRVAVLNGGDLCLLRSDRAVELVLADAFELALVNVPEEDLGKRTSIWRAALMKPIAGAVGVPAVLLDAVRSLQRWRDTLGPSSSDGLADAFIDLVSAVVCFAAPANADCIQRSLYHRERIKRFAQENLRNPELTVERIAEAVSLSPRQIHRLFANEAMSLMRWVWVQRLENCYRELRDSASAKRSISEIAYNWGFNDQAHFSRAFRKHFGFPPRDARVQAVPDA